jgi:hypothetical protein
MPDDICHKKTVYKLCRVACLNDGVYTYCFQNKILIDDCNVCIRICWPTLITPPSVNANKSSIAKGVLTPKLIIKPNPFNSSFDIELINGNIKDFQKIEIYDLANKLIYTKQIENTFQGRLTPPNLTNGIYIIRIIGNNSIITEKIIKVD